MTMRYTGGGHKQRYRIIDFKRTKEGIPATVKSMNMIQITAFIALLAADGEKTYVIAQNGLKVGQKLLSGPESQQVGGTLPLSSSVRDCNILY
jgi:large subunit ribosomal protein L2